MSKIEPEKTPSSAAPGTTSAVTFTHAVAAPPDRTYRLWTDGEHLRHWFAPPGVIITKCTVDLRVGGTFHYTMKTPDGSVVSAKWTYSNLQAPERLEAVVAFADETGRTVRAPWDPGWPLEWDAAATFEPRPGHDGETLVKVVWTAGRATAAEQKRFADAREDMTLGWNATFQSLDRYVTKR